MDIRCTTDMGHVVGIYAEGMTRQNYYSYIYKSCEGGCVGVLTDKKARPGQLAPYP
jgi:hypothetical protein